MKPSTLKQIQNSGFHYRNAVKFINDMIKNGVPLSSIDVNDWKSSPNTIVYISINGKSKKFKNRFGKSALKSVLKLRDEK